MKNEFGHDIIEDEGNVVPFPSQAQPKPAAGVNEFGHQILDDDPSHGAKLVTGAATAPEKAAKAINLSEMTKIPSPVVNLDLERHQENLNLYWGMRTSESNPYIKSYINNVPLAASVSKNDWTELDEFSLSLEKLRPKEGRRGGILQAFQMLPETLSLFGSAQGRERLMAALIQTPIEIVKGMIEAAGLPKKVATGEVNLSTPEGLDDAISLGLMISLGGRDIRTGAVPKSSPAEIEAFLGRVRGIKTREEMEAFIKERQAAVPPEKLQIEHAERSAESLKAAVERVNLTKTKEISPTTIEQFSEQHGDLGTVHIPASKILELYQAEGKIPIKGDGLFGFIPKLAEKMQIGAEAGTEIAIPLGKYVANVDPELHGKIADVVRVHQDGVTLEEAKGIKEVEEAKPQGVVAYHGTPSEFTEFDLAKIGTGEGAQSYGYGFYFAENPKVAGEYAKTTSNRDFIRKAQELYDQFESPSEAANLIKESSDFTSSQKRLLAALEKDDWLGFDYPHQAVSAALGGGLKDFDPSPETLAAVKEIGSIYKVKITPGKSEFLDWNKPLGAQTPEIKAKLKPLIDELVADSEGILTEGYSELYNKLKTESNSITVPELQELIDFYHSNTEGRSSSQRLSEAGIPGIKYLDQGSRNVLAEIKAREHRIEELELQKRGIEPEMDLQDKKTVRQYQEDIETNKRELESLRSGERKETSNLVLFDPKHAEITHINDKPISALERARMKITATTIDAQGKVRKSLYLDPIFTTGSDIGITQPEFAKYSNLIDRANEIILQKAVDFAEREVKKRQTAEWKSNESVIRSEVLRGLQERPDIKLDRFLRTGSLQPDRGNKFPGDIPKLDRDWVEKVAGKGALSRYTKEKDGADPQMLSDMFGFASKEDMVKQLVAFTEDRAKLGLEPKQYINELAGEETAKRMEAEHGKLEDNIAIEASEIALADFNVDLLTAEWRMLAELAGKEPPLNRKEMIKWVKGQFDKAEVSQVSYETFRRASEKAGREAEKGLLAKKYDEAFASKQTQMLNFLLAKEAKAFEKEVDRNEKLLDKYSAKANLPKVDQAFTDQIHALMIQYGVPIRRATENVEHNLEGKDLGAFIAEQKAQLGQGTILDPPALPLPGTAKLSDFTVNQYRDFASLIKNLDHVGKETKMIEVAGKKEDYFQVIDAITKNLDVLEKIGFDPDKRGPVSALRTAGRYIDSNLLKAETLINWMDLNDPMGAATQGIHRGLIEGQYKVGFMLTKIAGLIKNLPNNRAWGKALNELTDNKELLNFETREPLKLTNEHKISIALNYGNSGNRRVMLLGHHWTEGEVETYLDRTMSKMDWQVVKGIHGLFEPLAPLVEEVTRKRSGLAVPLVEPTSYLESKGGYYPLLQDPRDVLLKAKQQTDLFNSVKFDPLPMAPALKQRTGSVYKLDFSLNRLHSVLAQTTHAVYMQEPVINANKIIKDPLVREGIVKAFGPEYVRMLDNWIKDIANNGGMNDDMWASWVSRNLRESVVTQLMGWKVSTALIHGGSAGAATIYELGKMHLAEKGPKSFALAPMELARNMKQLGLGQFLPNEAKRFFSSNTQMWETINEVMAESQELPNRVRTIQKDFGFQLEKVFNKNYWDDLMMLRAAHNSYAMAMVSYLDLLTATPVYKAAKAKALLDGFGSDDAIFIADKAVREAHGSASLVSRANVGRGELNKWLTIAYNGYWNHNYNKFRQLGFEALSRERYRQLSAPDITLSREMPLSELGMDENFHSQFTAGQRVALTGAFVTAMLVAGAVIHHAIRGEEAETDEGAILAMMASQLAGQVPILNTFMYSIIHNRDPSISPIEEVLRAPVRAFRDMTREEPKHPIKNIAKITGSVFGFPSNQVIDLTTALREVAEGDQTPETPGDWARLVIRGHAQPKESGR